MHKKFIVICIIGLFCAGLFCGTGRADVVQPEVEFSPVKRSMYTPHAPIRINNDADFDMQFPGRIISGYYFNESFQNVCIYIGNCTKSFSINNCTIRCNNTNRISGITLNNVKNGKILNIESTNYAPSFACGIHLLYSNNNVIAFNQCDNNSVYDPGFPCYSYGIYLEYSDNNILYNNNCDHNTGGDSVGYGINGLGADSNIILNNSCIKNDGYTHGYGIYLLGQRNNISHNNCSLNRLYGIYIGGIYNRIHHNVFFWNNFSSKAQAFGQNEQIWNTSNEGNYWNGWTSPDTTPPFGIVDNPYNISGYAGMKDYFPLVKPPTPPPPPVPESPSPPALALLLLVLIPITALARRRRA